MTHIVLIRKQDRTEDSITLVYTYIQIIIRDTFTSSTSNFTFLTSRSWPIPSNSISYPTLIGTHLALCSYKNI